MLRNARSVLAPVIPRAAAALGVPRTLEGAPGVALTFDDGPHPEGTPAILEVLARTGTRATFFLIGEQVQRRPALAAEIVAAGHGVALHGFRHRLVLRLSDEEVRTDLERGAAAIAEATGVEVRCHRPPYGIYSASGLRSARALGLRPMLWSRWGKDWRKFTTARRIATRATREIADGDVILLHDADFYNARDSHRRTAQALPLIVAELRRLGLDTVLAV